MGKTGKTRGWKDRHFRIVEESEAMFKAGKQGEKIPL